MRALLIFSCYMITYIFVILYLLGLAFITWLSSRRQTSGDYINSSKRLSAWDSTWTTFASLLTGYNFVLGTTFAFLYGFWYMFAFLGAAGAFITLYLVFKRKLFAIREDLNMFSLGDFFGVTYGISTKKVVNAVLCLSLLLFLILQFFINGQLFSALLNISNVTAVLIAIGVVCAYLWVGGFRASVKTDIFQGLLILPIVLTVFFMEPNFSVDKLATALPTDQFWFAIGLMMIQFLTLLAQAESFQRIFAVVDARALKKGLIASFVMIAVVAGAIAYIGINFKFGLTGIDPANLFTEGVLQAVPAWLASFLAVSLIAAFMGTIDSSAFALAILLANWKPADQDTLVRRTRYVTVGVIALSGVSSLLLFSFLSWAFSLIALISIIGAALVASFIFKMDKIAMNTFLIGGIVVFVIGLVAGFVNDNPLTTLIPSGAGLVALILVKLLRRSARV